MDIFTRLIESIENTDFYKKYISTFPEPLNNVAFDLILIIAIASVIILPAVIEAVKTHTVRKRIKKRAEVYEAQMRVEKEEAKAEKAREEEARKEEREFRKEEINALKEFAKTEVKKAAVTEGAVRPFRISTRSMEPALLMNTMVYAKPVLASDVKEGDIVVYRFNMKSGPMYVIHRIIRINEDGTYILKGDNEEKEDPPVKADQIEYLVVKE